VSNMGEAPSGRPRFSYIVQDITQMRALQEQLANMNKNLEHKIELRTKELEEEKIQRENFVATLSHDLRTPLTAAKMSAQVLMRTRSGDEAAMKSINRIINDIDRADLMIRNLLDVSRIRAGEKLPM